jgi:integrase
MDIWKHKVVEVFYRTKDDELKTRLMVSCPSGRGKNGRMYWAPFTRKAQIIYNMYGGEFPHVSLQTYNRSIKKIAIECGVDLYLTTHIGRKTFATLMGLEGFSEPAIAVMLGNTEEIVRKHYKNTSQGMLFNELDRLGIESPDSPDHNLSVA